jgi:SAM-dependent methyltransferase
MVSAVWPFLGKNGHYTGFDIDEKAIAFARSWYPKDRCSFLHARLYNAHYNPDGEALATYEWPVAAASIDLAVAFSLFTHLNMPDSKRYFEELARVLKPNALALLTFFLVDDRYNPLNTSARAGTLTGLLKASQIGTGPRGSRFRSGRLALAPPGSTI